MNASCTRDRPGVLAWLRLVIVYRLSSLVLLKVYFKQTHRLYMGSEFRKVMHVLLYAPQANVWCERLRMDGSINVLRSQDGFYVKRKHEFCRYIYIVLDKLKKFIFCGKFKLHFRWYLEFIFCAFPGGKCQPWLVRYQLPP